MKRFRYFTTINCQEATGIGSIFMYYIIFYIESSFVSDIYTFLYDIYKYECGQWRGVFWNVNFECFLFTTRCFYVNILQFAERVSGFLAGIRIHSLLIVLPVRSFVYRDCHASLLFRWYLVTIFWKLKLKQPHSMYLQG